MAGPLSSEEIEDVVSSVRRLVSNELSPRRLSRDLGADRLLLTPSLRVVSETSPLAPLILDEKIEDAVVPDAEPAQAETLSAETDDAVELIEAEWEDEIWVAPEVVPLGEVALVADEAEVLLPVAEEAEILAGGTDDMPEPLAEAGHDGDGPPPVLSFTHRAGTTAERRVTADVAPPTPDDLEPVADAAPPSAEEVAAGESLPLDDLREELLAGQAHPVDDAYEEPTPDTAQQDYSVPEEPVDQSGETADNAASQRMPTEIIDADGTPLAVLDEAALQEIVRQMIREELQGDLGERITRNVRKLVRAEINRALMARDLD